MDERKIFIIQGNYDITEFIEINNKLHCVANGTLYKLQDVMLSRAVKMGDCESESSNCVTKFENVLKYFELEQINMIDILNDLDVSTIDNIQLKKIPGISDEICKKYLLFSTTEGLGKFDIDELINLTKYKRSILEITDIEYIQNIDINILYKHDILNYLNNILTLPINKPAIVTTDILLGILIMTKYSNNMIIGYEKVQENCSSSINDFKIALETCEFITSECKMKIIEFLNTLL